jgi:molybdate transport system regulatory protein
MRMSYKRAWQLIDELNSLFDTPLVAASTGGSGGGGASLTRRGRDVLARYRRMHAACVAAVAGDLRFLCEHRYSAAD